MKMLSYLALAGLSFLFTGISAQAAQDVTCWNGDCLQYGYTQTDLSNGQFTDFQCYQKGCRESGWIVGGTQNIAYYTQCKAGGCYAKGWFTFDRLTQKVISETRCNTTKRRHDGTSSETETPNDATDTCLTYGWTTFIGKNATPTYCIKGDCSHQGWVTVQSTTQATAAYCKRGNCFSSGWYESN
jgi:hypothetical protein